MPSIETEPRNMDALELLQTLAAKTDSFLKQWLDSRHGVPNILMESIQYSLFGPGKRVRPVLALLNCQAVGGHIKQALPAAGALELIHCFSLTHDDLPAMDNDDLRRGRPTNHKVYGETVAILTGDAMNTMAFELLVEKVTDPVLAASLVGELATATGPAGMIGGQILDICHPRENPNGAQKASLEKLQRIHRMKTGFRRAPGQRHREFHRLRGAGKPPGTQAGPGRSGASGASEGGQSSQCSNRPLAKAVSEGHDEEHSPDAKDFCQTSRSGEKTNGCGKNYSGVWAHAGRLRRRPEPTIFQAIGVGKKVNRRRGGKGCGL
ncbi:MAG: polyprenyl synthetase family protein [Planctomycetes bacterium]|nr:polyprenyl synthetase family protein [Planctomycetota bacterium]